MGSFLYEEDIFITFSLGKLYFYVYKQKQLVYCMALNI